MSLIQTMTDAESKRLAALEAVIQSGEGALLATAHALRDIKISRLYREKYATFEIYCQERWGFTRQRGYQLVVFSEEVQMSTTVDTQPKTEREARQLRSDRNAESRKPIVDRVVNPAPVVDVEPQPKTLDKPFLAAMGLAEAPKPELPPHHAALIEELKLCRDNCDCFIECVTNGDCEPDSLKDAAKHLKQLSTLLLAYAAEINQ